MAALNAEVAHNLMILDRFTRRFASVPDRAGAAVPRDFRAATTVYESLAGRLGELPADVTFVVVTLYTTLEEMNRLPGYYADFDRQRHEQGAGGRLALGDLRQTSERFHALLDGAMAGAELAHDALFRLGGRERVRLQLSGDSSPGQSPRGTA